MAKEDKPLPYERRIIDTKSLAQRLVLGYQEKDNWLGTWKKRLAYAAPLCAAVLLLPFVSGIGGGKRAFTNGPVSKSHVLIESNCKACHSVTLAKVQDRDCRTCHDGPRHQPNTVAEPGCAECHIEHQGSVQLAALEDGACTRCHNNLDQHGKNLRTKDVHISGFTAGKHPEFAGRLRPDTRPLKLNHAAHLPRQARTIRGLKLPMKCVDCHSFDRNGTAVPITFEKHCASCHKGELGFDVYEVLGADAGTVPHNRDPQAMALFIRTAYTTALRNNPALLQKPLSRNLAANSSADAWLKTTLRDSYRYLFEKKCVYCHDVKQENDLPVVAKVTPVTGHYPDAQRWLAKAEFRHPAHRMIACDSCHAEATKSQRTSDVLIPAINSCLPCHGKSGSALDNCSQCHSYHQKSLEREPERRTIEQITGKGVR